AWAVEAYGIDAQTLSPMHTSISFDLTVTSLWPPLIVGGCVSLVSCGDVTALLATTNSTAAHVLWKVTPSHLSAIDGSRDHSMPLAQRRTVVVGGEPLASVVANRWRATGCRIVNEYGPTETVVGCCVHDVGPMLLANSVPIGRPIRGAQTYVLDRAGA